MYAYPKIVTNNDVFEETTPEYPKNSDEILYTNQNYKKQYTFSIPDIVLTIEETEQYIFDKFKEILDADSQVIYAEMYSYYFEKWKCF